MPPSLRTILEEATKISATTYKGGGVFTPRGQPLLPGVTAKFPANRVVAFDRVNMWVDGQRVCLGMWPAELKPQYTRVYSDPTKVEALITLVDHAELELHSNFHLAYRFAQPIQRWYPRRRLPGAQYVSQWIDDFRGDCAGARSRDQLADPIFSGWLVERQYAHESELASLDDWLASRPTRQQLHIRPSIEVLRTWPYAYAAEQDHQCEFVAEIREAIDRVLSALDEPALNVIVSS
jgi:O-acetyl-ADP-ribose deacetylase